jgi:Flp pilus assembly protein TadD
MRPESDEWDAQMEMGMALLASGDWKGAATAFAQVRKGAPGHLTRTIATNNLAWTNLMIGTPFAVKQALTLAKEATNGIDVDTPRSDYVESVKSTLAFALIKYGDNAGGLALIDDVLAGENREPRQMGLRLCIRAIALARAGDTLTARSLIRRALLIDPRCQLLTEAIESVGGRTVAVPVGLQDLTPLLEKFGISDDVERGRVVSAATTRELKDVVAVVTAEVLDEINQFLDETFDAEYAVRYGDLAQAAMEARLELKKRGPAAT